MTERQPLFTPPRFYEDVEFHRHTSRTISWLELFYDLVYVATLIQIGNFLSSNVDTHGFAQFLVLMVVVWWAWTGETFYQNRYVVDDLTHRLLVFTQMFAVATIGLSVSEAFGDLYIQFTLAYVVIRLMLILMYLRAMRSHPESRELARGYVTGFSFGVIVWLGSLLLPAEIHWVGWLAGIAIELSVPLVPRMRHLQRQVSVDYHHVAERFGIFTIIVLGESFVKVLDDAQGITIEVPQMIFSTFGLIVLYSLWWLYFTDTTDAVVDFNNSWKPITWIYAHFPLAASLVMFGVGAKKLFAQTWEHPDEPLDPEYRLLYTGAVVLYLLAVAVIDASTVQEETHVSDNQRVMVRVLGAIVVGILGLILTELDAVAFVTVISVVMMAQVAYSIYHTRRDARLSQQYEN